MRTALIILFAIFISSCNTDIRSRINFNTVAILFVLVFFVAVAFYFFYMRKKWLADGYLATVLRSHSIDYFPSALAITDDKERIIVWNHRAEEIFGWKEVDLIGMSIQKMIPKDQCKLFEFEMKEVLDGEHPKYFEMCMMRKNGKIFSAEMKINIHREHSTNHFLFVMRDISERIAKERALQEDLTLFREGEILGGMGSWQWDLIKDEVLLSPGFQEIFDIYQRKVSGNVLMRQIHIKDRERVGRILKEAITNNEPYEVEYTLVKGNQEMLHVKTKARPQSENGNGTIKVYNGVIKIKDENDAGNTT